jgi:hypothetical protein
MSGTPHFRCRFEQRSHPNADGGVLILGRLEVRRPTPLNPAVSSFSPPVLFKLDTGAAETAVDDTFAAQHGFADYRQVGTPISVQGFHTAAAPLPAWRVYRWVRFRDYRDGLRGRAAGAGGIPHLEFRTAFLVVPAVVIPLPLLGLRDVHRYFTVGSAGDDYTFFARSSDGSWPLATDGGQGVREAT